VIQTVAIPTTTTTLLQDFDSVMSTNVRGYFLCLKYEIPLLLSTGTNPCVVLVSSTEGHTAVPGMVGYVASKWAIRGLALTAAADYGPKGLRVNCVSPGE
jgi:dihydroanticapsin dehydrogenase